MGLITQLADCLCLVCDLQFLHQEVVPTYYVILTMPNCRKRYIHYGCLKEFCKGYVNDAGDIEIIGDKVIAIYLYNSNGMRITKTNYICRVGDYITRTAINKFVSYVDYMYTPVIGDTQSGRVMKYAFNDCELSTFLELKKKFNYKGRTISEDVTPNVIAEYLSS